MPSVVSIFCGCGGLDLGFKDAGFDLLYACDKDPASVDCYARNIDYRVHLRDVTSEVFRSDIESLGSCDLVLGGFPCQGFSKAGPKQENDQRNTLYVEMTRVVARLRPHIFIAENVDGITQNFNGSFLKRIVADFRQIDYEVDHCILDAVAFGVPQHRRRVFFVGVRQGLRPGFPWPKPTHRAKARNGEFRLEEPLHQRGLFADLDQQSRRLLPPRTIRDAIGDLVKLSPDVPDHQITSSWPKKYERVIAAIRPGQKLCNVRHADTSVYTWEIPEVFGEVTAREVKVLETISKHRRHKQYGEIPNGNPLPPEEIERLSGLTGIGPELRALLDKGYLKDMGGMFDLKGAMFCSGLFKRSTWDEPSPTVLTNFHNPRYFLHPEENRPFSLRECARLQTFPDGFVITGPGPGVGLVDGYRLIGNAVPPLMSRHLASSVLEYMRPQRARQVVL
jgi:DNA (cytosine-5)-methyltransferase 1